MPLPPFPRFGPRFKQCTFADGSKESASAEEGRSAEGTEGSTEVSAEGSTEARPTRKGAASRSEANELSEIASLLEKGNRASSRPDHAQTAKAAAAAAVAARAASETYGIKRGAMGVANLFASPLTTKREGEPRRHASSRLVSLPSHATPPDPDPHLPSLHVSTPAPDASPAHPHPRLHV